MVTKLLLKSKTREKKDTNASLLRREGYVPAVLYGPKTKNINLKVKNLDLDKIYQAGGESALIDLEIDNQKKIKIIIKDTQKNPVKGNIEHADFYVVDMKKPIEVEIPLEFIGEAPAVRELGGTFMKNLETIQVKCLPGDLIENIAVDLSSLKTYEDNIKVNDLKIPENFEVLTQLTAQVANVLAPRIIEEEEEEKKEETAEESAEGEDQEEKKDEADKKNKETEEKGKGKEK